LSSGRLGSWTFAHKRALRIATVVLASVALAFWSQPTGAVVLGITIVALVVLVVIELVGRPPAAREEVSLPEQKQRVLPDDTDTQMLPVTDPDGTGTAGTDETLPQPR
jgi:hypothetical protein